MTEMMLGTDIAGLPDAILEEREENAFVYVMSVDSYWADILAQTPHKDKPMLVMVYGRRHISYPFTRDAWEAFKSKIDAAFEAM